MNIFKKLFKRNKKASKPTEKEAWFNDASQKKVKFWQRPISPEAPWSDNSVDNAETMKWAKD